MYIREGQFCKKKKGQKGLGRDIFINKGMEGSALHETNGTWARSQLTIEH